MQRDHGELSAFDAADDFPRRVTFYFIVSRMVPVNENLTVVEDVISQALPGVVEVDGADGQPWLTCQMTGDFIAQKVAVSLLLTGLLLVPYNHLDRLRGREVGNQEGGQECRHNAVCSHQDHVIPCLGQLRRVVWQQDRWSRQVQQARPSGQTGPETSGARPAEVVAAGTSFRMLFHMFQYTVVDTVNEQVRP